ncbi:MAG: hypothetical protein BWY06_01045 [Candidatus Latescibacteria bacterium ADurb.Bin168]|nr:MAG: hypothetical protein BWY06_01045 [Candidatus Latescibacteria bacterium ADurb.Bin168]
MPAPTALAIPAIICYSVSPTAYLNEHAAEIKGLYDGFFFQCGSWDSGVLANIGVGNTPATNPGWLVLARENVAALKSVGCAENLLAISFGESEPWPSPETLLSNEFTEKLRQHFSALGRAAKSAGFRGISIDTEYPYPRYSLDHPVYTYAGYTPGDLMVASYRQGRVVMSAVLDEFPEAVIFNLPGSLEGRPLAREFVKGLIEEMADRNAPGGFHFGTEYSYTLHEPVTQAAIPRHEDGKMDRFLSGTSLEYWRRVCTMAPGVWPCHMVETGADDYPVRPWNEEMAELRQQMRILRSTTKRFMWSFSGQPIWLLPSAENRERYGLSATYPGADVFIPIWHDILRERVRYDQTPEADPRMIRLFDATKRFDEGRIDVTELCNAFGTPAKWWALGVLSNPFVDPARTAREALSLPISPSQVFFGRDGAVRWFPWAVQDNRGVVSMRTFTDYLMTDDSSVHLATYVHSPKATDAWLNVGWDDGIVVQVGDRVVFDRASYPERGHGAMYLDRYQFEAKVPIHIPAGVTRINVTTINAKGGWMYTFRITDADGYPLPDLKFSLED